MAQSSPGLDPRLVLTLDDPAKPYAETWRVLELSTKCAPSEAFQVAAETRAFLTERAVNLNGEQQTKTRKALEFFAAEKQSTNGPPAV